MHIAYIYMAHVGADVFPISTLLKHCQESLLYFCKILFNRSMPTKKKKELRLKLLHVKKATNKQYKTAVERLRLHTDVLFLLGELQFSW